MDSHGVWTKRRHWSTLSHPNNVGWCRRVPCTGWCFTTCGLVRVRSSGTGQVGPAVWWRAPTPMILTSTITVPWGGIFGLPAHVVQLCIV